MLENQYIDDLDKNRSNNQNNQNIQKVKHWIGETAWEKSFHILNVHVLYGQKSVITDYYIYISFLEISWHFIWKQNFLSTWILLFKIPSLFKESFPQVFQACLTNFVSIHPKTICEGL